MFEMTLNILAYVALALIVGAILTMLSGRE